MCRLFRLLVVIFPCVAGSAFAQSKVTAVGAIGMTVSDMDRSIAFFHNVLTFQKIADHEFTNDAFDQLEGVFAARVRVVDLRLGQETLRLTEYLTPGGRPLPVDSQSNDLWFEHIAIVVHDMDAAYARLRGHKVLSVSSAPQTLPAWNHAAAGIRAFYFRDPDNHVLELIYFPEGKGNPRWRRATKALFLGIDHTAIAVSDTAKSLHFYHDTLGFRVTGESENYGTEQEHLNHVPGSHVCITSLRSLKGPGIELLQYLTPGGGRLPPSDEKPCDMMYWQTVLMAGSDADLPGIPVDIRNLPLSGKKAALMHDPDGHAMQLTEP